MSDINLWLAIAGAILSAVVGLLSGVAVAGWWLGIKNNEHVQVVKAVENIQAGCPTQHAELVRQLKEAVCSGFKLAISELGKDVDTKLSERDRMIADQQTATAVLTERMRQAEADIEAIFGIFNRRDVDVGNKAGERRHERGTVVL